MTSVGRTPFVIVLRHFQWIWVQGRKGVRQDPERGTEHPGVLNNAAKISQYGERG